MRRERSIWIFGALFAACGVALPWIGAEPIGLEDIRLGAFGGGGTGWEIFFSIRLPRVAMGLLAGGALAAAGATLQATLRNPLAEPWTLGIAGGTSLGAFAGRALGLADFGFGPLNASQALALAGAALALGATMATSRRRGVGGEQTTLLAGITIGVTCGGAIMAMSGFVAPDKLANFHRWLLGGLDGADWETFWAMAALSAPGLLAMGWTARDQNPLGLGEEMAAGQGVDVGATRRLAALGAGLAAAGGASAAVGLLAPHAARRLAGPDARIALPCSFLLGGALLAGCDAAGRWLAAPLEMPVGATTALLGGPLFLALLARRPGR